MKSGVGEMVKKLVANVQRFGAAMYTPVLLLTFAGITVGITTVLMTPAIMGNIALPDTNWFKFWDTIKSGTNAVMKQLPFLFLLGLPIGLAKKEQARAGLEAFVLYMTFNYFVSSILIHWGSLLGVDASADVGGTSGLAFIGGIKTLDTGMVGALVVAGITVWLHNKYFDTQLPEWLGVFRGSSFIAMIGFFAMIPVAVLFAIIWPQFQHGIANFQGFMESSGSLGVGIYGVLERGLIPTGLHHFIYTPFLFDSAVVEGGIRTYWAANLSEFSQVTEPLKTVFPAGGFSLFGMTKVFAPLGIALAFWSTAKPEKKQNVVALMVPAVLTGTVAGITEPLEFTFLFIAPVLFVAHVILAGLINATAYYFGVVGEFSSGLLNWIPLNWLPLGANQWQMYLTQVVIGVVFTFLWFVSFRFLILKLNLKTPGREDTAEVKLFSKADYKGRKKQSGKFSKDQVKAATALTYLGGADNLVTVANCATRLRVTVKELDLVASDADFQAMGAHGVVRNGNALQVIIGLSVPNVKGYVEEYMATGIPEDLAKDLTEESTEAVVEESNELPMSQETIHFIASQDGQAISLEEVPDEVFSQKLMGDGIAIISESGNVYSPVAGEVTFIAESNHAFGLKTSTGLEVIIHIGLETVALNGQGLIPKVEVNDQVEAGQLLCEVDHALMAEKGIRLYTPIIVTNLSSSSKLKQSFGSMIARKSPLFSIETLE